MHADDNSQSFKKFYKGDIVFREGDTNKELYIIISGQVHVVKEIEDNEVILATLETGDFFGEMAMFGGEPRSATIRVKEDLEVLMIS